MRVDQTRLAALIEGSPPRRMAAGPCTGLALVFVGMWLSTLLPKRAASTPLPGNTIHVLDLGLL